MKTNMKRTALIVTIFAITSLVFGSFVHVDAGECKYGTLYAWYSIDGVSWENATVNYAPLKRGEPFYIKATVTAKTDLMAIAIELWETGIGSAEDSSMELLDGPDCFFHFKPFYNISKGNTSTYIWKLRVRPDTNWVGGNAPLNIQASYNINDNKNKNIYFTIVNINIIDGLWENESGYSSDNDVKCNCNRTPGFELTIYLIAAIAIFYFVQRTRN